MKSSGKIVLTAIILLAMYMIPLTVLANVPSVSISAPSTVSSEMPATVTVIVNHLGSGPGHFVDKVTLYDGNKMLKEWSFDSSSYKKGPTWDISYTGNFDKDANLKAIVHCNIHGDGAGTETMIVK
ncbi:hypothetical protein CUJ83_05475 [Methanocella sp. CWC-04]|uniref:Desulfoferrodoxin ferrous iron-binding domain-containing protein n=1 Tax=Methanooceanicella nereidis TaxID=2052831 RepID=A0AAP2W6N3_9EURY|nr:desulfoferrodoxin family protein [Methanocella sp. CWC-04]MCD1294449.1 hypothetical protein [Methanocella sp. CWC-04]